MSLNWCSVSCANILWQILMTFHVLGLLGVHYYCVMQSHCVLRDRIISYYVVGWDLRDWYGCSEGLSVYSCWGSGPYHIHITGPCPFLKFCRLTKIFQYHQYFKGQIKAAWRALSIFGIRRPGGRQQAPHHLDSSPGFIAYWKDKIQGLFKDFQVPKIAVFKYQKYR